MYARWFFSALIQVSINLLIWITSPFWAALSMLLGRSTLPGWLSLIHTHDDDLDGGQHQLGWPVVSGFALWWQRTCWICRNPGYGFAHKVFGMPTDVQVISETGPTWTGPIDVWHSVDWKSPSTGRKYFMRRWAKTYGSRNVEYWIGWSHDLHILKFQFNPFLKAWKP